jgi:hypothetical protein
MNTAGVLNSKNSLQEISHNLREVNFRRLDSCAGPGMLGMSTNKLSHHVIRLVHRLIVTCDRCNFIDVVPAHGGGLSSSQY